MNDLEQIAKRIRRDVIQVIANKSGHPGGALGIAEILAELYFKRMKFDPKNVNWEDRDRFVLSNGHICAALYSAMAHAGYFEHEELLTLRNINSRLQAHPSKQDLPGIETAAGPLGQGLSIANGIALAQRLRNSSSRVYCLVGDGEIQEGQIWEAVMTAAHHKLNQVALIVSWNNIQIDGTLDQVKTLDPIPEKFRAFGWNVIEIDGHNLEEISNAFDEFEKTTDAPTAIIAKTILGSGVSFMEDIPKWHGNAPNAEEGEQALQEIGPSSFAQDLVI